MGVRIKVTKVKHIARLMALGVMSIRGVVVDGRVVYADGVPDRAAVLAGLSPRLR